MEIFHCICNDLLVQLENLISPQKGSSFYTCGAHSIECSSTDYEIHTQYMW